MSGLKIAALYGIYPHQLGFCGPKKKSRILSDYLLGKKVSQKKIKEILEQFKGAFFYYKLIAESNRIKDPFNRKVVKAYWIGNDLLDNVSTDSLKELIINFSGLDFLSKEFVQRKAEKIPAIAKPHHSFHVFIIGSVTGTIKLKGGLLDVCRVGWGEVREKKNDKVVIKYQPIKKSKSKYFFGKFIKKTIFWDKELIPDVKIGEMVSCHWNHLIQILNKQDLINLKKYTRLTLDSLNSKR